jgi:NADH-quinone oxidoreductase subunit L
MTSSLHLWLIPVLPLIGAAINGFFGRHFSRRTVAGVALTFCGAAFLKALFVAAQFSSLSLPHTEFLAHWIRSGDFLVNFEFYLDQLTLVMLLVVTGVGFLIHIYSVGYMWEEGGFYRFFSYLNLFMFFMLTLVLAGRRGSRVLPVDRILVYERFRCQCWKEGFHCQSHRRLRISDRVVFDDQAF